MRLTRAASEAELTGRAAGFLREMGALGVTTVECKTGYGLDREHELRLLRVYRTLAAAQPIRLVPTFLGAHLVPPEYRDDRGGYLDLLIDDLLPVIGRERLAAFCDVFVERSAFTVDEARRLLRAAQAVGLGAKLHADQLTQGGGAELAAELGAVSADHLECASDAGISAMARAGVVAVSLPLASLYLGQVPAPARRWIEAGVAVAVATDFNPGSAPSYHLPFALTLACTLQRMTPSEALKGATVLAARAVGLESRVGSLEPGKAADFALIDAPDVNHWLYHLRANACRLTVVGGRPAWAAEGFTLQP
jgi:imidazolonepropionase